MAGISDSSVIDLVTYDPSRDEIAVIMIADRPWSDSPELLDQIVAKLNTYVHFIQEGSLVQNFPQAAGKAVRIQVDCNSTPTGKPSGLIDGARDTLLARGIGIAVNVIT